MKRNSEEKEMKREGNISEEEVKGRESYWRGKGM